MASVLSRGRASLPRQDDMQTCYCSCAPSFTPPTSLQDGPVPLRDSGTVALSTVALRDLPNPLADWPEAMDITNALYRRNKSSLLHTLTKALRSHPTAEVYDKLQTLICYLDIPDPVQQLLPPLNLVSLQHFPVLDLHYYAMAKQAVDTILSSTAFVNSSSSGTWKTNAAYFFVSVKEVEGLLAGVSVYSVGGGNLREPSWACRDLQVPSGNCNIDAGRDLTAVLLSSMDAAANSAANGADSSDFGAVQLPEGVPLWDVARADCSNGSHMVKGISQYHKCFGCHMVALMADAVSGICLHGEAGLPRAASGCVEHRAAGYVYEVGVANLWVVYW